jgi:hypothetical protein
VRKLLVATVAFSAIASSFSAAAHAAPVAGPNGRKCSFNSASDPDPNNLDPNAQTGQINGGPLVGSGVMTCTFHVGGTGKHSSPFVVTTDTKVDGTNSGGVTTAGPAQFTFSAGPNVQVYLCTSYTEGSTTIYWVPASTPPSPSDPTGHWSDDPNDACGAAISINTGPIVDLINGVLLSLDPLIICPALQAIGGALTTLGQNNPGGPVYITAEGDTYIAGMFIYDCPMYAV